MAAALESLPYIDAAPTDAERSAAAALITAELPADWSSKLHERLPTLTLPTATAAGTDLVERASRKERLGAIDATRYGSGALEAPSTGNYEEGEAAEAALLAEWRGTMRRAYALYSYLGARGQQLSLLEAYGKNAWLVGNAQLEDELRAVERRLADVRERTDAANRARRDAQQAVGGELDGLAQTWKEGVQRLIEVQVATAEMELEIQKRRPAA